MQLALDYGEQTAHRKSRVHGVLDKDNTFEVAIVPAHNIVSCFLACGLQDKLANAGQRYDASRAQVREMQEALSVLQNIVMSEGFPSIKAFAPFCLRLGPPAVS